MHKVSHCLGNHPIQIQSSKIVGHFLRQRVSKSVCFIGHMGPKTEGGREAERGVQARFTSLPTCTLSELHPARLAAAAAALLFLPLPLRTGCGHCLWHHSPVAWAICSGYLSLLCSAHLWVWSRAGTAPTRSLPFSPG